VSVHRKNAAYHLNGLNTWLAETATDQFKMPIITQKKHQWRKQDKQIGSIPAVTFDFHLLAAHDFFFSAKRTSIGLASACCLRLCRAGEMILEMTLNYQSQGESASYFIRHRSYSKAQTFNYYTFHENNQRFKTPTALCFIRSLRLYRWRVKKKIQSHYMDSNNFINFFTLQREFPATIMF
jgi:hypothetical protein